MGAEASQQFPHALDWIEFGTIRWQKEQLQDPSVLPQPVIQVSRVVIGGVVRDDHHPLAPRPAPQQGLQKGEETLRLEHGIKVRHHLPSVQIHCTKQRHRFARGCVQHHRIGFFRRNPHGTATAVLLEVTFIQTPQIKRRVVGQADEFF